jgi:hypothetical protein
VPADLRATLDKLHDLYGRDQSLPSILAGLNTRLRRAREMYGPERPLPAVVTGFYDKLDNLRRLYSRIYGRDLSIEAILDIIILQTRRFARLIELQSHTMVSKDELEEIEFLKRMFRRFTYDLAKAKAAQRADTSAQPIVMPIASATAPTNGNDAAHSSPANGQKKAQSRSIVPNKKTAKTSLPR